MLRIDKQYDDLPWLSQDRDKFKQLISQNLCPQALLIHGPSGCGKRHIAIWIAEMLLKSRLNFESELDDAQQIHPDLLLTEPEADKIQISVDQIRSLVEFFALTSHQGSWRCAIIYPAEKMNRNGFNSLLKTLEEPPSGSMLMILAESLNGLPSTLVSRCHRLRVAPPSDDVSLAWLSNQTSGIDLIKALKAGWGSPLNALKLCNQNFIEDNKGFESDMNALINRDADPVSVALRWSKKIELAMDWLVLFLLDSIRNELINNQDYDGFKSPLNRYFSVLEQVGELRKLHQGGVNSELMLRDILMQWYGSAR